MPNNEDGSVLNPSLWDEKVNAFLGAKTRQIKETKAKADAEAKAKAKAKAQARQKKLEKTLPKLIDKTLGKPKRGRPKIAIGERLDMLTVRVPHNENMKKRLSRLALLFAMESGEKVTGSILAREILQYGIEDYEEQFAKLSLDDIKKRRETKNEKRAS